jgi:hypothetical protein
MTTTGYTPEQIPKLLKWRASKEMAAIRTELNHRKRREFSIRC